MWCLTLYVAGLALIPGGGVFVTDFGQWHRRQPVSGALAVHLVSGWNIGAFSSCLLRPTPIVLFLLCRWSSPRQGLKPAIPSHIGQSWSTARTPVAFLGTRQAMCRVAYTYRLSPFVICVPFKLQQLEGGADYWGNEWMGYECPYFTHPKMPKYSNCRYDLQESPKSIVPVPLSVCILYPFSASNVIFVLLIVPYLACSVVIWPWFALLCTSLWIKASAKYNAMYIICVLNNFRCGFWKRK